MAERDLPKVSIVILNWNGYEVSRECLASLMACDYPNYEIILVDNGSKDDSPEKLRSEFPNVVVIRNDRNLGFTGGNNVGMRRALSSGTDYLLLLNNDTVVAPEFLKKLIQAGEASPRVGILNPKIYYFDHPDKIWYAGGSFNLWTGSASHHGHRQSDNSSFNKIKSVTFITGCAFLIKAQVAQKIGLLDDQFFYTYEDAELSLRVLRGGYEALYVPSAVIWHKESYDIKKNAGKAFRDYYNVRNCILLMRKHGSIYHWPSFLIALFFLLAYRTSGYLVRREYSRVAALYRGLWAGFSEPVAVEQGLSSEEVRFRGGREFDRT